MENQLLTARHLAENCITQRTREIEAEEGREGLIAALKQATKDFERERSTFKRLPSSQGTAWNLFELNCFIESLKQRIQYPISR